MSCPRWPRVSVGWIPAFVLMGIGCTSTGGGPGHRIAEMPAEVTIPRTSTGQIDFVRLRNLVHPFIVKKPHTARTAGQCAGSCLVDIEVQEIGKSYDIDPLRGPPRFRIIGSFLNKDAADAEHKYRLRPRTKYYVWVDSAPLNRAQTSRTVWGLIEVGNAAADLKTVGYVERCEPGGWEHESSNLDFYYCDPNKRRHGGAQAPSVLGKQAHLSFVDGVARTFKAAEAYPVPETWFECDPGCCSGTSVLQQ